MEITTAFKEGNINESGWTSQYSFVPELMLSLNNIFVTIKNGQLFIHNDKANPVRNNFYGEQFSSSITTIFNDINSEDKIWKTLVLESDQKWKAELMTNLTKGEIFKDEFSTRESRQFSFIRGNEDTQSMNGNSVQGVGVILSSIGPIVSFGDIPYLISIGDMLMQVNNESQEQIGTILSIDREANTITVDALITAPENGFFSYSLKSRRVEGEEIRGHYLEVKLTNEQTESAELFAVSTNAVKSYV